MSRPVGGYKCRSLRLKKKHRKWCCVLALRILEQTLNTLADGAHPLRAYAYRKYDLFNQFYRCPRKGEEVTG